MTEKIELSFDEMKQLEWSDALFEMLYETLEELEENKPYFRFFKNGEAEIVQCFHYSPTNTVSIGEQGVEGENWESFLQELKEKGIKGDF